MPRFFLSASEIGDGFVTVTGDDALHISRSLRMRAGEHITVCDGNKTEYDCELCDFTAETVRAKICSSRPSETEPPCGIRLFQALPKSDKLDMIIQKAVESGAAGIVPFESERTVVRIEPAKEVRKTERRNKIALEAAKQCGRGIIPEVGASLTYSEMLREAGKSELKILFYEGEGTESVHSFLERVCPDRRPPEGGISILVGAEGGFSLREVEEAKAAGFVSVGLGKRILRCETASGFALACLAFWFEL